MCDVPCALPTQHSLAPNPHRLLDSTITSTVKDLLKDPLKLRHIPPPPTDQEASSDLVSVLVHLYVRMYVQVVCDMYVYVYKYGICHVSTYVRMYIHLHKHGMCDVQVLNVSRITLRTYVRTFCVS